MKREYREPKLVLFSDVVQRVHARQLGSARPLVQAGPRFGRGPRVWHLQGAPVV